MYIVVRLQNIMLKTIAFFFVRNSIVDIYFKIVADSTDIANFNIYNSRHKNRCKLPEKGIVVKMVF